MVETGATGYSITYSADGTTYTSSPSDATVNTDGTLYVKNTFDDGDTPYGTTVISKTVRKNGTAVSSDDLFMFRIDISYTTSEGLKRTKIDDYSKFVAIRYSKPGVSGTTLGGLISDRLKNEISYDKDKTVTLFAVLKGGESINFRILEKGATVNITELAASDSDLITVANYSNKTGFSDRYIASFASTKATLSQNSNGTFSWGTAMSNGSAGNDEVLKNITASFTVDKDKREYSFINDYTYSLTVKKKLSGSMASRKDTFVAEITLNDVSGNAVNHTFNSVNTWLKTDGTEQSEDSTITFVNGKVSVTLRAGSSVTINGIPTDYTYEVKEQDYRSLGYTATYTNESGTITADKTCTITNKRDDIVPTGVDVDPAPALGLSMCTMSVIGAVMMCKRKRRKLL